MSEDKRPRISEDVYSIIQKHADRENKSNREILEQMIHAYDKGTDQYAYDTNELVRDIHSSLGLSENDTTTTESTSTDTETSGIIDYNSLQIGHNVEIDPEQEDWDKLLENNIIKQGPQYYIPLVQGWINYQHDVGHNGSYAEVLLEKQINRLNLSPDSVRNYLYKYGPRHDAWYPDPTIDRQFPTRELYNRIIEDRHENLTQSNATIEDLKEDNPSLESFYDEVWDPYTVYYFTREEINSVTEDIYSNVMQKILENARTGHAPRQNQLLLLATLYNYIERRDYLNLSTEDTHEKLNEHDIELPDVDF